jgi:tRNA threonylcarbamoyladenosine biosynthesis protein TsaB
MDRLILIETSGRVGRVALANGPTLVAERTLDEARRHARDLAPAIAELLRELGWRPRDLGGVVVSLGPGSYTGLRVGITTAKTLAFAIGCAAIGVPTFQIIARQSEVATPELAVIADALKGDLYVQVFRQSAIGARFTAAGEVAIVDGRKWAATLSASTSVTGPGLKVAQSWLPVDTPAAPAATHEPSLAGLIAVGWEMHTCGAHTDPMRLEPLYLRRSSAEEQWDRRPGSEPINGSGLSN